MIHTTLAASTTENCANELTHRPHVVLAIDSFKGCLTSEEAEKAAAEGVKEALPTCDVTTLPMSDGGDGMLEAFSAALNGNIVSTEVHNPLMEPIKARYAVVGRTTAIIEVAEACGLKLIEPSRRDILHATTYGVGELLLDAWRRGCRKFIVGLGGTGTSDCGRGMIEAIRSRGMRERISTSRFILASDVTNPLYGRNGAAEVYGPQKGATRADICLLELRARRYASENRVAQGGRDCSMKPGAGAAGGLGYAFMQFFGARMESGGELLMKLSHFDERVKGATLIITGEGAADRQTLMGKLPSVVLRHGQRLKIPVALIAGRTDDTDELSGAGFSPIRCINPPGLSAERAMRWQTALSNVKAACRNITTDFLKENNCV